MPTSVCVSCETQLDGRRGLLWSRDVHCETEKRLKFTKGEITDISDRVTYELKGDVVTFIRDDGETIQNCVKIDGDTLTVIQSPNKEDLVLRRLPRSTTQPRIGDGKQNLAEP